MGKLLELTVASRVYLELPPKTLTGCIRIEKPCPPHHPPHYLTINSRNRVYLIFCDIDTICCENTYFKVRPSPLQKK